MYKRQVYGSLGPTSGDVIIGNDGSSSFFSNIGIGTTTPQYLLNPSSATSPQLALSAGAGLAQWTFRNAGGSLFLSTTTVAGTATSSLSALEISGSGFGTTTVRGLNISGQATSTSNVGFNITAGCFAVGGTCLGSSSGNVSAGTTGQIPYYAGAGTTLTATSSLFINTNGNVGVGTATPSSGRFQVRARSTDNAALVIDSGPDANPWAIQFARDSLSSAYVYMQSNATLGFQATLNPFTDNDASQTLGTPSFRWNALNVGTGASSFGGALTVGTTLGVTGATTLSSTLSVTGRTSLAQASTTGLSAGYAYFGTTATSSFSNTGVLTLASALGVTSGGTGISSPSVAGVLLGNYAGTGYMQIATSSLGLLTTNVSEGSNLYYTDARVNTFINASTTIPKTYTNNVFAGTNTFNGNTTLSQATTTNLAITNVTNTLLKTNATGGIIPAIAGTDYVASTFAFPYTVNTGFNSTSTTIGFTNGLFSTASSTFSGPFRLSSLSNGGLAVFGGLVSSGATTTAGTGLTYSGNAFNVNTSQNIATLSNLTSNGFVYTAGGNGTLNTAGTSTPTIGGSLSYSGTIGQLLGGVSGTLSLNTANTNTWTALQSFGANASTTGFSSGYAYFGTTATSSFSNAGTLTLAGSLNGPLQANNGVVSATSSVGVIYGGTGITSYSAGDILYASGSGVLAKLAASSNGLVLKLNGGLPSWQTDLSSGGGGGATAWSTSTNSMIVYPTDTTNILVLGSNATTTTGNIFEVAGNSLFGGDARVNGEFIVTASTSLQRFSATNATTTSLAITGVTGTLLKTNANGSIIPAIAGTDYQSAGAYITALTGDITASGPGSAVTTLATVNGTTGSFGGSTAIPTFTVNAKGLITTAGTAVVIAPAGTLTGTTLASNVLT